MCLAFAGSGATRVSGLPNEGLTRSPTQSVRFSTPKTIAAVVAVAVAIVTSQPGTATGAAAGGSHVRIDPNGAWGIRGITAVARLGDYGRSAYQIYPASRSRSAAM